MAIFYAVLKSSDKLYKMSDNKGKGTNKMAKFTITLTENYDTKTYRIDEGMFLSLGIRLAEYRSCAIKSKSVRCIENGKIFDSAAQALKWLCEFGIEYSNNNVNKIKNVCKGRGRIEKVFGFHWQYVNNFDREINNTKKQKLERWLYYACLKNEVHSRSFKLTEELLKTLQNELEPYCTSISVKKEQEQGAVLEFENIYDIALNN